MGKPQKQISIQGVHKIWHLIVGGIEKLDYQSDAQLQKVFTDLVVKWIPQFRMVCGKMLIDSHIGIFMIFLKTCLKFSDVNAKTGFKTIYCMCTS